MDGNIIFPVTACLNFLTSGKTLNKKKNTVPADHVCTFWTVCLNIKYSA